MLSVTVPAAEYFDEATSKFVSLPEYKLELEHSLVSLSKWEAIYEKAFLGKQEKTTEEVLKYVELMNQTPDIPPEVFLRLSRENIEAINEYIGARMTATWFRDDGKGRPNSETITAEIIYYWMIALGIPFECQEWHLSRLLTLIKVCNRKNAPPKKMGRASAGQHQKMLNAQRRRMYGTSG